MCSKIVPKYYYLLKSPMVNLLDLFSANIRLVSVLLQRRINEAEILSKAPWVCAQAGDNFWYSNQDGNHVQKDSAIMLIQYVIIFSPGFFVYTHDLQIV